MARKSLLIANPFDNNHIGLINSYEKEQKQPPTASWL